MIKLYGQVFYYLLMAVVLMSCDKSGGKAVAPPHVAIVAKNSKYILDPNANRYITMGPATSKAFVVGQQATVKTTVKFTYQAETSGGATPAAQAPFYVALIDDNMQGVHKHDSSVAFRPGENKKTISTSFTFKCKSDTVKALKNYNVIAAFKINDEQVRLAKQHLRLQKLKFSRVPSASEIARTKLKRYKVDAYDDST